MCLARSVMPSRVCSLIVVKLILHAAATLQCVMLYRLHLLVQYNNESYFTKRNVIK